MIGVGVGVIVVLGVGVVLTTSPEPRFSSHTIATTRINPTPSNAYKRHLLTPEDPSGTEMKGARSFVSEDLTIEGTRGWGVIVGVWGRGVSGALIGGIVILGIGAGAGFWVGKITDGVGMLGAAGLGAGGIAGFGALSCINCLGIGAGVGLVMTFSISLPAGF